MKIKSVVFVVFVTTIGSNSDIIDVFRVFFTIELL